MCHRCAYFDCAKKDYLSQITLPASVGNTPRASDAQSLSSNHSPIGSPFGSKAKLTRTDAVTNGCEEDDDETTTMLSRTDDRRSSSRSQQLVHRIFAGLYRTITFRHHLDPPLTLHTERQSELRAAAEVMRSEEHFILAPEHLRQS